MIIHCQGVSPDGAYICRRPTGHDDRDQPCKNPSSGAVWCSLCDEWSCEHIDPLVVAEATVAMKRSRDQFEADLALIRAKP